MDVRSCALLNTSRVRDMSACICVSVLSLTVVGLRLERCIVSILIYGILIYAIDYR